MQSIPFPYSACNPHSFIFPEIQSVCVIYKLFLCHVNNTFHKNSNENVSTNIKSPITFLIILPTNGHPYKFIIRTFQAITASLIYLNDTLFISWEITMRLLSVPHFFCNPCHFDFNLQEIGGGWTLTTDIYTIRSLNFDFVGVGVIAG